MRLFGVSRKQRRDGPPKLAPIPANPVRQATIR
jgi:hypothetical protein